MGTPVDYSVFCHDVGGHLQKKNPKTGKTEATQTKFSSGFMVWSNFLD
jgi:hypothetical protein